MQDKKNTSITDKPAFVTRTEMIADKDYVAWLKDIKQRFRQAQSKAAVRVNTEMLKFYWSIGRDMYSMHIEERWGEGIVKQFALDMRNEFPGETGFSYTNVKYMRRWYNFYYEGLIIGQQLGDQFQNEKSHQLGDQLEMPEVFGRIPWRHHVEIFTKCSTVTEALFYVSKTVDGNWSRNILVDNIDHNLYAGQGTAITNFESRLPAPQGLLAQEILKDPYNFDFLTMQAGYDEKELEAALVANVTRFLLELGKGFAYVGRQMELRMEDGQSFYPDLVFYHIPQKRYVVIDLKVVEFKPEFAGKINFYVSAADELLKGDDDNPTIGLLICKSAKKTIVEWSLRGMEQPLEVATYQLEQVVERTMLEMESKLNSKKEE